jgi:hypothetical protein
MWKRETHYSRLGNRRLVIDCPMNIHEAGCWCNWCLTNPAHVFGNCNMNTVDELNSGKISKWFLFMVGFCGGRLLKNLCSGSTSCSFMPLVFGPSVSPQEGQDRVYRASVQISRWLPSPLVFVHRNSADLPLTISRFPKCSFCFRALRLFYCIRPTVDSDDSSIKIFLRVEEACRWIHPMWRRLFTLMIVSWASQIVCICESIECM